MIELKLRKGAPSVTLTRDEFRERFRSQFVDPAYAQVTTELDAIEAVAWDAYAAGRKAPRTRKAGEGFADPDYELSLDWLAARDAIHDAQRLHDLPGTSRILVINGSARSEHTCPGELSKTHRLAMEACTTLRELGCEVDYLDLSNLASEYGRVIYPCKACVSTAMPLCHWPCSCYPNHGLGQTQDWMNELYPRFVAAHGLAIVTPVYWYQAPSVLKLLIDRLVCADGGNPDPTSTQGKDPGRAKALELAGWGYPRHLEGRVFSVITHGDASGIEALRRNLHDTLVDMKLEPATDLDRFIGYLEPYATSHEALDQDDDLVKEVTNVMRTLAERVEQLRSGVARVGEALVEPRPK